MDLKTLESLGVVIGAIIATTVPYIAAWIKSKLKKNQEGSFFIKNTECRAKINEVLIEIRAITGANRVSIVEYHNGNTAINGLPFNYASMTYEKTDQNTRGKMAGFQKVPISPISELLLDLHESDSGVVKVSEDYKHPGIVEFFKYHGSITAYIFRIGDHVKYGSVELTWVSEEVTLTDEEVETLHYKIWYINDLMSKMKKH